MVSGELGTLDKGLDLVLRLQLAAAGHQGLVLLLSGFVTLVNTSSRIRIILPLLCLKLQRLQIIVAILSLLSIVHNTQASDK